MAIPREGELIFVLDLPGFRCNPPRQSMLWEEYVHKVEFRIKAPGAMDGHTCRGHLRVFLGDILLAEVALRIAVSSQLKADKPAPPERVSAQRYRKIFASYSRRDMAIVEQFERYAAALGDRYLRDLVDLQAGEKWNDGLKRLIDEADVFQLFWSRNSMASPFVRDEWMYALSLNRENFIRPMYWEQPFPEAPPSLPPAELRELHFNLLGRYVSAVASDGGAAAIAETPAASESAAKPGIDLAQDEEEDTAAAYDMAADDDSELGLEDEEALAGSEMVATDDFALALDEDESELAAVDAFDAEHDDVEGFHAPRASARRIAAADEADDFEEAMPALSAKLRTAASLPRNDYEPAFSMGRLGLFIGIAVALLGGLIVLAVLAKKPAPPTETGRTRSADVVTAEFSRIPLRSGFSRISLRHYVRLRTACRISC
jgi:hypothetical protein